jgi:hypothetical protein
MNRLRAEVEIIMIRVLMACLLLAMPAYSQPLVINASGARPIPDSYFGMHVRWGATTYYWPKIRFYGWRIITEETSWYNLEPKKGLWKFYNLDLAVARAQDRNVEVMLTLGQTPAWASARPYESVPNGMGVSAEPSDMADWENYIRTVATRYKGKIKYYELWNEPRFREVDPYRAVAGFTGSAKQMVEMGTIAKRVLNEVDPEAKLTSPAADSGMSGLTRVKAWLDAGGGKVSDVIAYHLYVTPPEKIPAVVQALRKLVNQYGLSGVEIWNTESGFQIENPDKKAEITGTDVFGEILSVEKGAAYVSRSLILGAASGLDRYYWYSWDIPTMALTEHKGQVIALTGYAYIKTQRWLRGAAIKECRTNDEKLWVCTLKRDERMARLVWNATGVLNWKVPVSWGVQRYESLLGGQPNLSQDGQIVVDEAPLLLVSDNEDWGSP